MTPQQTASLLRQWHRNVDKMMLQIGDFYMRKAQRLAVTELMQGGGKDPWKNPPNPPPGPLKIRSGNLRRQVKTIAFRKSGQTFVGGLTVKGIKYAAIQEWGGMTRPHVIRPVNKSVLAWQVGQRTGRTGKPIRGRAGKEMAFARVVHHPGSKIPARPYLRPALRRVEPEIVSAIQAMARSLEQMRASL